MSEREFVHSMIAEAIYGIEDDDPDCEAMASAAIAALASAGYVIVKREPTEAMEKAGAYQVSGITRVGAGSIYRAMIAAQEQKP